MARRTKISGGFSTILSTLIMSLIMCMLVSFVYKRTDEFTGGFKSFYIEYGNTKINNDFNHLTFESGKVYNFEIESTIDDLKDNDRNYKVSVIANPDVEYTIHLYKDGVYYYKSLSEVDLNLYFSFTYGKDNFSISDSRGTLENFINSQFKDYDFVDFEMMPIYSKKAYFRLVVSSLKDVETINIDFNLTR